MNLLLVRVEHIDGRPIEPEILAEAAFKELCTYTNPSHTPHAVEILSLHEICLTYKQGITLGHVAGELMAIESWMDFPILVTIVIIKRSKVDTIVEARQKLYMCDDVGNHLAPKMSFAPLQRCVNSLLTL